MFKLVLLSVFLGLSAASKYGSGGGSGGGSGSGYGSIELPVKSRSSLEVINTPSQEDEHSTYVDIPGGVLPVYMTFKTESSPLHVRQEHKNRGGSYQKSDSKDEPHRLLHEVVKPVIQELREVITPYRKVVQVIQPVQEERLTKVHKGERNSYGGNGGNDGGYGGSDGGYGGNDGGYGKSDGGSDGGYGGNDGGYGKSNDNGYGSGSDGGNDGYKGLSLGNNGY